MTRESAIDAILPAGGVTRQFSLQSLKGKEKITKKGTLMNQTVESRKAIYAFLYRQRVESPHMYYDRGDFGKLAPREQVEATIAFGKEMGHLEPYRKHYYHLTAQGMLFAESNQWIVED